MSRRPIALIMLSFATLCNFAGPFANAAKKGHCVTGGAGNGVECQGSHPCPAFFDPLPGPFLARALDENDNGPVGWQQALPRNNYGLAVDWFYLGENARQFAGPTVDLATSIGAGSASVFLGVGSSYVRAQDLHLALNGLDWHHQRVFSTLATSTLNWQGEGWWSNEMKNITVAGTEGASDVSVELSPHYTYNFTYASGSWTCDDNFLYSLSFSSGDDEYILMRPGGEKLVFHDSAATDAGKLKRIEDAFSNDWQFNYSSGQLTDIVVDVIDGNDHKITYSYFTSGDSDGLLQYVKAYKSTTTTDANLIGKVEYVYHDSTVDDYGSEDDLMKVIVSTKGTTDGDGVLSIEETYHYRYYKGSYDENTNPGTDHQLRFVLLPENADRLNTAEGDPLTQSNDDFDDYANIIYEYDSDSRVRETQERLAGSGCGCGGAGGTPATTEFTWAENTGSPDLDTWKLHGVVNRADDTRVIFDVNRWYQVLTWVIQDEDDGTPTKELIWHYDYGTSGAEENRLTNAYNPSACSDYDEDSPYGVTLRSSEGVVYEMDYDYSTDTYDGYPEKIRIKKGSSGTADTLVAYGRTIAERPDLVTSVTEYESGGEADGRTTSLTYSFYDSGGDKVQIKQIDTTHPSVSTAKNGPGSSAVTKGFFDKRTGALRWTLDGEGYVNFMAYDDETGVQDLTVVDANTSSLMTVIDDNWDGVSHGGLAADDTIPFSRSGEGTALDIDSSLEIDWLGRTRKAINAEGMITYTVYKDDETRVYPAWDTTSYDTLLPIQITLTDKEGRAEDSLTLNTDVTPTKDGSNEPTGAESYSNSDLATRTVTTYNISGMVESTDRYHAFPASDPGTRYTHFYRTSHEYDSMGRTEYVIQDVADESTHDREQISQNTYDFVGRLIKSAEGVSDNTHDITTGKPTLNTLVERFYDDPNSDSTPEQGEGDGNISWVRNYYGTGAGEYDDTEYQFDWRSRRCVTVQPAAPHTLAAYDNLNRATAIGIYSSTTNLDPGDDPSTTDAANRLSLEKIHYDERGQVYKTDRFDDPSDTTPADALVTNAYRDRRGLTWAVDSANTGIRFTEYDGAGRLIESSFGTQFDSNKYTSDKPDYPDNNEGIVSKMELTLDLVGNVEKTVQFELEHDDANGMGTDDYVRTYVYNWYDDAHRLTDSANYGTNQTTWKDNATAPTYGSLAPTRSDTVLVTTHAFDNEGRLEKTTDPQGVDHTKVYDQLRRTIAKIEDEGSGKLNRKTEYEYNGQGSLVKIIHDPSADNTFANGTWTMVGSDTDQVTEYTYEDSQSAKRVTEISYPTGDGTVGTTQQDQIDFTYNVDGTVKDRTDQNGTKLTWSYDELRRKTEEEVTTVGTYNGGTGAVDSAVRSFTWTYNDEGHTIYTTSHTDTTPDTSNWTDAANQIQNTFDAADNLTKQEQEEDGKVVAGSPEIEYSYATDYSTGNYNRKENMEFSDDRKIWYAYTHSDVLNGFQATVNNKFSRIGQIAKDNSGAIGDPLAEYDFVGLDRMVRRVHDEDTGVAPNAYGNDTRMDLWHGTSGDYAGLDRFGRIIDMKHTDFSGSAFEFARRQYGYDRNGNRTHIDHVNYKEDSQSFSFDNLNRLIDSKRGFLDSSDVVQASDVAADYNMDLLGNFVSSEGGIELNEDTSPTVSHAINATNEITSISRANPSPAAKIIEDDFGTSMKSFWTNELGTFNISSNQANVRSLSSGEAILLAEGEQDIINYSVDVTFPSSSSTNKAGLIFAHDGNNSYYAVVFDRNAGKLALHQVTSGSWGSALDSDTVTVNDSTAYTLKVQRRQGYIEARVVGQSSVIVEYTLSTGFGSGMSGLYGDKTNIKFDNFYAYEATTRDDLTPRISGLSNTSISSGQLVVNGGIFGDRGGDAIVENFFDDDYIVDLDFNNQPAGDDARLYVRYIDANNSYEVRLDKKVGGGVAQLYVIENGERTFLTSGAYPGSSDQDLKILLNGSTIKVWVDGTLEINTTDSTHSAGTVAFGGDIPKFDNVKIGYDNNADDDIDDAGDDLVMDENFGSTSEAVTYDHAGNLVDDGRFIYVYDAWNRLVEVRAKEDDVTIQTAEFDAAGRRIKKTVTNTGEYDKTEIYLYDGQQIAETLDGSGNMVTQFIHGTQYIDELVMVRAKDKGELYIHQDADRNVIATTDLGGSIVERNLFTPYGQLTVQQETAYGDRDGDGDVDSTDKGTPGVDCTGTVSGACRILDLDFDGDYDSADATLFDSLPQGLARHPGRVATATEQSFGYHGHLFDPEIDGYQTRMRNYYAQLGRYHQRDLSLASPKTLNNNALFTVEWGDSYFYEPSSDITGQRARGAGDRCLDGCVAGQGAASLICAMIPLWKVYKLCKCLVCMKAAAEACAASCNTLGGDNVYPDCDSYDGGPNDGSSDCENAPNPTTCAMQYYLCVHDLCD